MEITFELVLGLFLMAISIWLWDPLSSYCYGGDFTCMLLCMVNLGGMMFISHYAVLINKFKT